MSSSNVTKLTRTHNVAEKTVEALPTQKITVLTGGFTGSRFLRGLCSHLDTLDASMTTELTVIVNVSNDFDMGHLKICPDLDSIMYALAGVSTEKRESQHAREQKQMSTDTHPNTPSNSGYNSGYRTDNSACEWFTPGELEMATHVARTSLMRARNPLSKVTTRLFSSWKIPFPVLPVSDDPIPSLVTVTKADGTTISMPFQQWWLERRGEQEELSLTNTSIESAVPAPGVLRAIEDADLILIAPSDPLVSITPILSVPGIREAIASSESRVVAISPIVAGKPVSHSEQFFPNTFGADMSAHGVARSYGSRTSGGILDAYLIDLSDEISVENAQLSDMTVGACPIRFATLKECAFVAKNAIELGFLSRGEQGSST